MDSAFLYAGTYIFQDQLNAALMDWGVSNADTMTVGTRLYGNVKLHESGELAACLSHAFYPPSDSTNSYHELYGPTGTCVMKDVFDRADVDRDSSLHFCRNWNLNDGVNYNSCRDNIRGRFNLPVGE